MGNELRSPTKIGHLSLSDNSTDDYLYVQGVPIAGGGTPANMMTTDTEQDVTGTKTFVDNVNSNICEIRGDGLSIIQDLAEHYTKVDLNSTGALDILEEVKEAGEITERYQTTIGSDYIYFSVSPSSEPSSGEESYLRFPLGRDAEILATQNDIKKYYRHEINILWDNFVAIIITYSSSSDAATTLNDIGSLLQAERGRELDLPASVLDQDHMTYTIATMKFTKDSSSNTEVSYIPSGGYSSTISPSSISDDVKEI